MFDFLKKKKKEKELGSLTMPELPKLPEFPSLPEEKTLQKKSKSIKPKKMSHEIQIPNIKISAPKKPIEIQPEKNKKYNNKTIKCFIKIKKIWTRNNKWRNKRVSWKEV